MENKGQLKNSSGEVDHQLLFAAQQGAMKIFISATGIHYQFTKIEYPKGFDPSTVPDVANSELFTKQLENARQRTHHFTLALQNSNPYPVVRKEQQNIYTENYLQSENSKAILNVHSYEKIVLENVYPQIDWIIYVKDGSMKYDFLVHTGGNANDIQLKVKNASKVGITASGELLIQTSLGTVREKAPESFDEYGNSIATKFVQSKDGSIRFKVADHHGHELRIDPSITWSTYYGDAAFDQAFACSHDAFGNVYLAGQTYSTSNIAAGGYLNTNAGVPDAYLVKFNSSGARLWGTYYGGTGVEYCYACPTDNAGNVYLAGQTGSTTGIASGGFQNTLGGQTDAYLAKFSSSGSLIWATYYGGTLTENASSVAVDANDNVYLAGSTNSPTGIFSLGYQSVFAGVFDGFLVKFSSAGARLWGTYYGGSGVDYGNRCCVDNSGYVYLTGQTTSTSNISFNGFQPGNAGGSDAFLVKFDANGGRQWATYFGGTLNENGNTCITDPAGNVFMAGQATSTSGIGYNGFQNTNAGGVDAFLVKYDYAGQRLWSTYYGGSGDEIANASATDAQGNIFISGSTNNSATGIASSGFQNTAGGDYDGFVLKVDNGGAQIWSTYFGGSAYDISNACMTDGSGNVYIAGNTKSSNNIATAGSFLPTFAGNQDAFFTKIADAAPITFTTVANGNWNDPAIWSGGVVPTATSVVTINKIINVTVNANCFSIIVNNPGSITVKTGMTLTVAH